MRQRRFEYLTKLKPPLPLTFDPQENAMNEIICPHCGKAFKIDEADYADILKQVRDHEF